MLRDIKVLHLEPTDVCQASCPLCPRETDSAFRKDQQHHLNMHKIIQVFDAACIAKLDKMFMCGNYGDPAAGKHSLDIYQEFRKINPNIVLGMNSNGGIQNTQWWHELGRTFNQPQDYVVFSIDGLSDTNHIYRRGVVWNKMIENAKSFIAAGGSAHWDMLVYKHNEHQVDACEQLAQELGFSWFRAKVSKRRLVNGLEHPVDWQYPAVIDGPIECHVLKEQSAYIDAQGRLSPCCWIGQHEPNTDFKSIQLSWNTTNPNPICKATCTTNLNKQSSFTNQWQRQVALT